VLDTVVDTKTCATYPHRFCSGTTLTSVLWLFPQDHLGEPVPEENFWTLWCKGRLTEADTPTIRLGATPSGLTSAHLNHPPFFSQAGCPSCCPTSSVKALKRRKKTDRELANLVSRGKWPLKRRQVLSHYHLVVIFYMLPIYHVCLDANN